MDDPRFKKLKEDPKYRNIPKGVKKIDVSKDERFKNIFTDKKFANKLKIDEFGNKIKENNKYNKELEDYYTEGKIIIENKSKLIPKNFDKNDDKKNGSKVEFYKEKDENSKNKKNLVQAEEESFEESDEYIDDSQNDEFDFDSDDYRNESDSSDTSEQFEEFLNKQTDLETNEQDVWDKHKDNNIELGDSTKRISVLNLDWDNITAKKLFIIFNSLSNKENSVKSVCIYPSDFGLEEMKKEKLQGPDANIFKSNNKQSSNDVYIHDLNELNKREKISEYEIFDQAKLREYELKKMKYYYAVVELNSINVANYIYDNYDGMEIERTQMFLDLRFVPDDIKFPHKPKESCFTLPSEYEQLKASRALNHTNVKLTWDQTDEKREKLIQKTFKENFKEDEIQELLVSSDDDSFDENDKNLAKFLMEEENKSTIENELKIVKNNDRKKKEFGNKNNKSKKDDIIEEKDIDVVFEIGLEGMDKKIIREVVPDIKDKSLFEQFKERKKIITKQRKMEEKLKIDDKKKRRHQDKIFTDYTEKDSCKNDSNLDLLLEESKINYNENKKNVKDSRFEAIKTNKNYWIDPTNKNYKTNQ